MDASFRMRVGSASEQLSAELALAIVPYLQHAMGRRLAPIQLTLEPYADSCPFSDVRTWDWPSSRDRLRQLAREGLNLLILSERFLNWDTPAEVMNDDLYRFEDELTRLGMAVLSIEAYPPDHLAGMLSRFGGVREWFGAEMEEILVEMVDGYRAETLCFPYGALPYLLLDPQQTSLRDNHLQVFVGFQPWQYEHVLSRWPAPEFPMQNMLAGISGQRFPKTGAIPIKLKI